MIQLKSSKAKPHPSPPPPPLPPKNSSGTAHSPAVTFISKNHLSVPAEHLSRHHAQSDCGHGPPQLKRSHSLLRNFSLRSRKPRHQHQELPRPDSGSTTSQSQFHSTNYFNGSSASDINSSSSSIWKNWRVRSVSEYSRRRNTLGLDAGHDDAMSCPRKKSNFFSTVSQLVAPFQISSSSPAEHPSCSTSQLQSLQHLNVVQDKKVIQNNNNDNASSWNGDMDAIIGLIQLLDGEPQSSNQAVPIATLSSPPLPPLPSPPLPPLPQSSSSPLSPLPTTSSTPPTQSSPPFLALTPPLDSPPLPPLPLPSSSSPNSPISFIDCESDTDPDVALSLPLPEGDGNVDARVDWQQKRVLQYQNQALSIVKEESSSTRNDAWILQSESVATASTITTVNVSLAESSPPSTTTPGSSTATPNLNSSISRKRRAKFTLGDESDLECDPLGDSVSASLLKAAASGEAETAISRSDSGSDSALIPIVVPNNSAQTTTAVGIHRPSLARRERLVDQTQVQNGTTASFSTGTVTATRTRTANWKSTRRWTLSSALTDEGISDEGLIKELEKIREILEWDCTPIDTDEHDPFFTPSPSPSPSITPSNPWSTTQRALLTTRELILTERHYLSSLLLLLCPDSTLTPVPEMMVSYVKALVGVSERLLKGMEGEPSVRGVAEVFVEVVDGDSSEGAESAFVGWCGVVGGWFQDELSVSGDTQVVIDVKRKRKSGVGGEELSEHEGFLGATSSSTVTATEHTHTLMRTVSTWRRSMPSIVGLAEGGVRKRDRDKDDGDSRGRPSPTSFALGEIGPSSTSSKPIRKPTVRDLAILPTQRVMRYALLYRDLLANTPPSSSSYPIIERAVEVACRIAEKCDRAQGNAAFIAGGSARYSAGTSSNGFSNSILNNGRRYSIKRATMPEPSLKLKTIWGSSITHSTPSKSTPSSPTKSHFLPSSSTSPSQSPSKPSPISLPPSRSKSIPTPSSIPLPTTPTTENYLLTKPLPPPPPPSSFYSKVPIARSGQSFGSSTSSGSSTSTTTATTSSSSSSSSSSPSSPSSSPFCSLSSSSASSTLFLPKSTSSNVSSRKPKSLSAVSLMSLVSSLGRSVNGRTDGATVAAAAEVAVDSGPDRGYASASPTKI